MNALFLSDIEMVRLTGFRWKSKQVAWLRKQGIPFRPAANGRPVVTRVAIEGRPSQTQTPAEPAKKWSPQVLGA